MASHQTSASVASILLVFLASAAGVDPATAQIADTTLWVADGPVYAIVPDGNTLYIGGAFNRVGPATGAGVPLSVTTGAALPPFPKVIGSINSVVPDGSGGWYLGGQFTRVGVCRARISRTCWPTAASPPGIPARTMSSHSWS